ncbi:MAG TPA: hypothetical protein VKT77_01815 [Chthonomonadaceae bacterium]|nr:hypothetical protein [Chthonomonadaceae bacterium]
MYNRFARTVAAAVVLAACGAGCGGGASGGGLVIGSRQGAAVTMQPPAPPHTFSPALAAPQAITIEAVVPFVSTVHAEGTGIFQGTTQVVFGHVSGPTAGVAVIVYSDTNQQFIQPLTGTSINIRADGTWTAAANPGRISALLVRQGFVPPDTSASLPGVDGVNVLAEASE